MNDLLGLVKGGGGGGGEEPDVEAGAASPAAQEEADKNMEAFFKEVAVIKGLMADVRANQAKLIEAHEGSKTVTRSAEMKDVREEMQADMAAVSRAAEGIKRRLADLDKGNEAALKQGLFAPGSASERTRTAISGALKRKLKDMMAEFAQLRARLHGEYREVVERRIYAVTGQHADEDTIERVIDSGESENMFQKAILEQGRGLVLDTLAEIRERRDAVLELERSLLDLHQIFLDMAVLVEAQGEMLDNIEAQVARSVEFVQAGTTHLIAAKEHQKSMRKWMCCALIAGIIIVLIVVLVAVGLTKGFG
ncbi:hypothetical protein H632_c314p2 [Helicosporidium sp. ATCC 50920]|nr:hypothetical protein H632_c314p2 [Helicosporidium sp. ATCC 50920]|eukprot:KDD76209.1 hypothetical protein H632_c314p2 [Helicosporidium sp. ATCC 50920]